MRVLELSSEEAELLQKLITSPQLALPVALASVVVSLQEKLKEKDDGK